MPRFTEAFGFTAQPFERYVAENEPDIQNYAVTPPYFEEVSKHTESLSSFILFGYRGSGKSATRLTNEKNTWQHLQKGRKAPLVISLTDFEPLVSSTKVENVTANMIISHVAFLVIESILLWISNQKEEEQFIDLLNTDEERALIKLVKAHYLTAPDAARRFSLNRTMRVLSQTWLNTTFFWIEKKWEPISNIASKIISKLGEKHLDIASTSDDIHNLLRTDTNYNSGLSVLVDLVACVKSLGFLGICVYVDKVDETTKTGSSSEASARLVYSILSQVQLMEIKDFCWIFFLWDKVKEQYAKDDMNVRLDKFAFSEISWEVLFLKDMIKQRIRHFSGGAILDGQQLCTSDTVFESCIDECIHLVSKSPRELVRLLDVLVREYDVKYSQSKDVHRLEKEDFKIAMDSYVKDVMWTTYNRKILSQILRLEKDKFINRDVQTAFRISDQSARARIRNWISSGAVRQSGTLAGEGDTSGKPAFVYAIADPRISLMLERHLFDKDALIVDIPLDEQDDS